MKLVKSNGRTLTVRDVGEPLMTLAAGTVPIPIINVIEEDSEARERVRALLALGIYRRE